MVENTQQILRDWIERILAARSWSKTRLAREAGVAQTTITRLFDEGYTGAMNSTTVVKIAQASGISPPRELNFGDIVPGFREPEVVEIKPESGIPSDFDPHVSEWRVQGSSLLLAGYVPGDRLWVHDGLKPEAGDVVLAQIYNFENGTAETVIRIFNPPYLVTAATTLDDRRPVLVDGERVLIRGVVIRSERHRRRV